MRAFISYSTQDKVHAGLIKKHLESLDISSFLAHEDLTISVEWKDKILQELKASDLFIPLLSNHFKQSDWCSQEIGFAISRTKTVIIPLLIDQTLPYGFISHIQGKFVDDKTDYRDLIINALLHKQINLGFELVLRTVKEAGSFRSGEASTRRLVPYFDRLNRKQANAFAQACIDNGEVWFAHECFTKTLPSFLEKCRKKLDGDKHEQLHFQITEKQWYRFKTTNSQ